MADSSTPELPGLFTRAQGRARGLSNRQLDRRLGTGALVAARRGVLRPAVAEETEPAVPLDVRAALLSCRSRDLVVSHAGAARIYGLPKPLNGWPVPQFTATSGPTRRRQGIHVLVAPLATDDVVAWDDVSITSPARTIADCLRTMAGRDGLAVIDAALHRGLTTDQQVLEVLGRQSGWRGVGLARQVLALADSRRESPLESWSAWAFARTAIPAPQWQVEIRDSTGAFIGRGDCWWPGGVVGEADGRSKYALTAAERGGGAEAVFEVLQGERRREQRLREVGADVVRWTAGDVLKESSARALAQRISAAVATALDRAQFTGVVAQPTLPPTTGLSPRTGHTR